MKRLIAAAALSAMAMSASAALLTIDPISAVFGPTVGGTNVTYAGQNSDSPSMRWGVAATLAGKSGYDFVATATPYQLNVNPPPFAGFNLGTFSHVNQPISAGTSISGTFLTITYGLDINGNDLGLFSSVFEIEHWETPNAASPCADGGTVGVGVNVNGCADRVTITLLDTLSDTFSLDNVDYLLNVAGFTVGDNPFSSWWTVEGQVNYAGLAGTIEARATQVPEPAPLALMGLGLLGVSAFSRRKK